MVRQLPGLDRPKRQWHSDRFTKGAFVFAVQFGAHQYLDQAAVSVGHDRERRGPRFSEFVSIGRGCGEESARCCVAVSIGGRLALTTGGRRDLTLSLTHACSA